MGIEIPGVRTFEKQREGREKQKDKDKGKARDLRLCSRIFFPFSTVALFVNEQQTEQQDKTASASQHRTAAAAEGGEEKEGRISK